MKLVWIDSRRRPWKDRLLLIAICWLAFALSIYRLDSQPLWIDEGISLCRAPNSLVTRTGQVGPGDDGCPSDAIPPLYYGVLSGTRLAAGDSVLSLRLPSVWAAVLSIPLLFVLGRQLFGRNAGLWAALLGSVSPMWVWYTQAALPDTLTITMALLSALALHRLLVPRRPSYRRAALWLLVTALMVLTDRVALWVLAFEVLALAAWAVGKRGGFNVLPWVLLAVTVAVSLPLFSATLLDQNIPPSYRPEWYQIRQLFSAAAAGRPPPLTIGLRLLPMALFLLASLAWLLCYPRRTRSWAFAVGLVTTPWLAAKAASWALPACSVPPYWAVLLGPAYLLQGAGVAALWRRSRFYTAVVLLGAAGLMGQWLLSEYGDLGVSRGDLRAAADYVTREAKANDVVVLHNAWILPVWRFYYGGTAPVVVIPPIQEQSVGEVLNRFEGAAHGRDRVWFLRRPAPLGYFDPGLLPYHADTRWVKFDQQDFSSAWLDVELDGYQTRPPIVEAVPSAAGLSHLCWPGGLCLLGWSASNLVPGSTAELVLYWTQTTPTASKVEVHLSIHDQSGQMWTEHNVQIMRFYPVTRWPTGRILMQTVEVPLSPAFPPSRFLLSLDIEDQASGQELPASTGKVINDLGSLSFARPEAPVDPATLALRYRSDADFGDTLRLLGYNLPNDTPRPGHTTFVDFDWQVLATPSVNWQQRTRLVDREATVWVERIGPLSLPEFDILQWRTGDLIWGRVFLPLPGRMPAGEYRVEVALLDPAGLAVRASQIWRAETAESVVAGPAFLDNWPLLTTPPDMPHRPDVVFANAVRLWGYSVREPARLGQGLAITLVWFCQAELDQDYHVFVHLMDEQDALLGQSDGVPADWTRPTTSWRAGEYIVDEHTVAIPADARLGPAYLWVGLYAPDGSGRVPVSNAAEGQPADRARLDIVVIEP